MDEISEYDIRVDVYRNAIPFRLEDEGSWPTVKVTHLPTGRVRSRTDPSQLRAREAAIAALDVQDNGTIDVHKILAAQSDEVREAGDDPWGGVNLASCGNPDCCGWT